ncbi:hypothetical protein [Bradyrhizobium sp. Ai1a-2]|uniref:hypothetical protein n=1 Tax=Bradyrhizobium sp. Ai1a-2 TaxID=196490 RepID=UPI000418D4E8|nr:hypothetical protein [Bradyrhizobium sp. Ai1a-2]
MTDGVLTIQKIMDAMRSVRPAPAAPRVLFTTSALKETTERLFPASRHRSRRIHKKLVKRFGGEFRKEPAMWQVGGTIYAHPALKVRFEQQLKQAAERSLENAFFGGMMRP